MTTGHARIDRYRRRLRRERAVRLWAGRALYTTWYVLMVAATVILLWLYGPH